MSQITTHILDTSCGRPAASVNVSLEQKSAASWTFIAKGITDNDGRIKDLLSADKKISHGTYRLIFETGKYFSSQNVKAFYPSVIVEFEITDDKHYHVPLLLNPFGYSTYRGS